MPATKVGGMPTTETMVKTLNRSFCWTVMSPRIASSRNGPERAACPTLPGSMCIDSNTMTRITTLQRVASIRLSWPRPCGGCGGETTRGSLHEISPASDSSFWIAELQSHIRPRETLEWKCRSFIKSIALTYAWLKQSEQIHRKRTVHRE